MASTDFPWLPSLLLISLTFQASISSGQDRRTSVRVGFVWEKPRQGENHNTSKATIDTKKLKSLLRLVCFVSPPLPASSENKKNEIVKWEKIMGNKKKPIEGMRYWDDALTKVAISLEYPTYDIIGSYICSYGQSSESIRVQVADIDVIKKLKMPSNFNEVINYATHLHDGAGIEGWGKQPSLSQSEGRHFTCKKSSSKSNPSSVNGVRPSDIRVIAAVGDGFTSGFGAKAISWNGFFTDYRGISWSIGSNSQISTTVTLPNIIKEFNPKLRGFSTDTSKGDLNKAKTQCSSECLEGQVNEVIAAMKNDKSIDYQNDWKLLTIWTGMVDLCYICQDPSKNSSGTYIKHIMHSLNTLKKEVPRLYINLVPPLDVSVLHELFIKKPTCQILGQNSCPCASTPNNQSRHAVFEGAKKYLNLLEKLVNSGIYDVNDQFTVALQPFIFKGPRNKEGKLAEDLFGPDCLHFNAKGHESAAVGLWNSMLVTPNNKPREWKSDQPITCPTRSSQFIATKVNNNLVTSDDDDQGTMPPAAAITLSIILSLTVLGVTIFVWRSRKSRSRNDTQRLLAYPQRPRLFNTIS